MKKLKFLFLSILVVCIASCSSDDDGAAGSNFNVWVVYLQGEDGGIDIQFNEEVFCYEEDGCSSISGMSFVGTFGSGRLDVTSSNPDKTAVGVKIENIQVSSGSGRLEVVRASVRMEDGFEIFEEGPTLFTSPRLTSGETYTLDFGTTN